MALADWMLPLRGTYVLTKEPGGPERMEALIHIGFVEHDSLRHIATISGSSERAAVAICLELNRYVNPQQ